MAYALSHLTLHLTYPRPIHLPHGTVIALILEDSTRSDVAAITLAHQTVRCAGTPPSSLILQYDPRTVDPKGALSVKASIECEGNVLLCSDEQAFIAWPRFDDLARDGIRLEPVTLPLIEVGTRIIDGIHGGNLAEGIHGGNLFEGRHTGDLAEGIHGWNSLERRHAGNPAEGGHGGNWTQNGKD